MLICELLETCKFYNDQMTNMPATADIMKERFCRRDKKSCARYRVFAVMGREKVPSDLYPNDIERAEDLVSKHEK